MKTAEDVRRTKGRLFPWIRYSATCDWCDSPAVKISTDPPEAPRELLCDEHNETRLNEICDKFGYACSVPIRRTWHMWLWDGTPMWRVGRWLRPADYA